MKPRAFLSYRHNFPAEIDAKDMLVELVNEKHIELVYDKSVTKVDDCVIEFMTELVAARCVFIFISIDYFKSAYTLFELISINETDGYGKKVVLPICLSEIAMNAYDYEEIKKYWDEDGEGIHNLLAQLLSYKGQTNNASMEQVQDKESMWKRVCDAWMNCIFPYVHKLRDSDGVRDVQSQMTKLVDEYSESALSEVNQIQLNHRGIIVGEVIRLLSSQVILKNRLLLELKLPETTSTEVLAQQVVSESGEARQLIGSLNRAAKSLKSTLADKPASWVESFEAIKKVCGLLLLNTINSGWWFNHELSLRNQMGQGITVDGYYLEQHAFVEVIISKDLLSQGTCRSPSFSKALDPMRKVEVVVPRGDVLDADYNAMMLFDGLNENAIASTLLGKIYMDLYQTEQIPDEGFELIEDIYDRVEAYRDASDNMPVYYIVKQDFLDLLKGQTWFPNMEQRLKGYLHFVCCSEKTIAGSGKATKERQRSLLAAVGLLLDLDKDRYVNT